MQLTFKLNSFSNARIDFLNDLLQYLTHGLSVGLQSVNHSDCIIVLLFLYTVAVSIHVTKGLCFMSVECLVTIVVCTLRCYYCRL